MKKQTGFSIVMAIFILVVLSLLGGYMVKLSGVQHATSSFAIQSARAYQAARAGISWSVARISATGLCNDVTSASPMSFTDINGFSVTLSCNIDTEFEAAKNLGIYQLTALSQFGAYNSANYISRNIELSVCLDITGSAPFGSCN